MNLINVLVENYAANLMKWLDTETSVAIQENIYIFSLLFLQILMTNNIKNEENGIKI